jgi:predicted RecB family nuclease
MMFLSVWRPGLKASISKVCPIKDMNRPIDTKIDKGEIIAAYRVLAKEKKCRSCAFDKICQGITKPYIDLKLFKADPQKSKNFS